MIEESTKGKKTKNYKLKASSVSERELWVEALRREINKAQNSSIEEEMKFVIQVDKFESLISLSL